MIKSNYMPYEHFAQEIAAPSRSSRIHVLSSSGQNNQPIGFFYYNLDDTKSFIDQFNQKIRKLIKENQMFKFKDSNGNTIYLDSDRSKQEYSLADVDGAVTRIDHAR